MAWHRYDDRFFYLVHDTSPDVGAEGIERFHVYKGATTPGAPTAKRFRRWARNGKRPGYMCPVPRMVAGR